MSFLDDFKKFALRGSLLDMAIGFTVGAAFTTVARSLVDDIIMPPVGLFVGGLDFSDLFVVLKSGTEPLPPQATLADAQDVGAVTLNYGRFINNCLALSLIALSMFVIIRLANRVDAQLEDAFGEKDEEAPLNKKCPYCRSTIAYAATRCPHCTSQLELTQEETGTA